LRKYLTAESIVGIFALVGLAIIIYMSLEVSETNIARGKAKRYFGYFDEITGVVNKSPIETAGIRIGYIESITLKNAKAYVALRVIPDLTVYQNAKVWIKDRGLLGDRYLKLDPGTPDYPPLTSEGEIKYCYSQSDLDKLMSSLGEAAENIQKVTKGLGDEGGEGAFGDILSNFKELAQNLNEMVKANRSDITKIVKNLSEVTDSLKFALGTGGEEGGSAQSLKNAINNLDSAMESLASITKKIDDGEGAIGKLVSDEATAEKLEETLDGIHGYIEKADKIQTGVSYRGEYLTDTKSMQHAVGIKIQPKPDKYIKFEFIDAPTGKTVVTDTTVVIPPNDQVVAQTKTIETTDRFLFSLELAKRIYDLNVRFGIIRSQGGIAFDYFFINDLLSVSFEAFHFSRYDNRPQLRSYATLTLFKYLQLAGGVNDAIEKTGNRDWFFGAGFAVTDNDIKTILSSFKIPGI